MKASGFQGIPVDPDTNTAYSHNIPTSKSSMLAHILNDVEFPKRLKGLEPGRPVAHILCLNNAPLWVMAAYYVSLLGFPGTHLGSQLQFIASRLTNLGDTSLFQPRGGPLQSCEMLLMAMSVRLACCAVSLAMGKAYCQTLKHGLEKDPQITVPLPLRGSCISSRAGFSGTACCRFVIRQ